jgi:hypothetical protein
MESVLRSSDKICVKHLIPTQSTSVMDEQSKMKIRVCWNLTMLKLYCGGAFNRFGALFWNALNANLGLRL